MYLHPALVRDLAAERHADDRRRAAPRRLASDRLARRGVRLRSTRDRAGPLLRFRLARLR
jgi:hypothetical protein